MDADPVFKRYEGNPIVTAKGLKNAHTVFNSAVTRFEERFAGVFRVDNRHWFSELRVGWSTDGIKWRIDPEPIKFNSADGGVRHLNRPANSPYDPRIVHIDGIYYVTFCHYPTDGAGPAIGLARTRDFREFELMHDVILPFNRNAVLFPRKIDGRYAMLHRPSDTGHTPFGEIYHAVSEDLLHWGQHRFVFGTGAAWQATKVGPGPAPIETDAGWLLIYHGVKTTCSGFVYCAGGAILDRARPWKTLHRCAEYLLAPTEPYERVGDVPNVVFPCGAVHNERAGTLDLYYGCADTCIGMATARLDDLIDFIRRRDP